MNKEEGFDNYMSRLLSPCKNCAAKEDELKYLRAELEANKDKVYTKSEYDELGADIERLEVELENVRLYFSLTEIEFDNLKINNNDKYL